MSSRPVVICIPARDEAERLPALIRSLAAQDGLGGDMPLRVVVVANNCTDDTVPVLEELRHRHAPDLALNLVAVRLEGEEAHVGVGRRLAMDHGAAWLEREGADDGVLITTDADAVAPCGWVAANLAALDQADLVGGRLCLAPEDAVDPRLDRLHNRIEDYWAGVRALEQRIDPPPYDPDPRHGDHTGASIALSVALYRRVGGLPALACGEDNALVNRVRCLGGRVRHCPTVTIAVSPRRVGRVEGGMSSEMLRRARIAAAAGTYLLPSADHWRDLLDRRAALRRAWIAAADGPRDVAASAAFGLDADDVAAIAPETCPNDIAFVERAMVRASQQPLPRPLVDLEAALAGLDALLADPATRPAAA